MSIIKQDYGDIGGGIDETMWEFELDDFLNATDSNPYIINGNFSNVTAIYAYGQYSPSGSAEYTRKAGTLQNPIVLGTQYKMNLGASNAYTSYRNITVYSDRIEIGSGGYGSTVNSQYGNLLILMTGIKISN